MIGQVPSPFPSGCHRGTWLTLLIAVVFGVVAAVVLYAMLTYAANIGR